MSAFPPLDDLLTQFRDLARQHPELIKLFDYGRSRRGESLLALRLGDGPARVLAYAFPQPDEPLGGLALLHLTRRLLQDAGWRRLATWTLVPCVDPDGARLNQGWFSHPLDLGTYARNHYRPPEGEQVEWSFPSSDPDWPWDRPLPETRALKALLDAVQPQLLFPLHNALLGGAYAFVSEEAVGLAPGLPQLWRARGLPSHRGEPELPFAPCLAPGVYRLPYLGEIAEALRANGVVDPAGLLQCGAPAYLYARRYGAVWTVVPELPLFALPAVEDVRPAGSSRRQMLRRVWEQDRAALAAWLALYEQALPFLGDDNVYRSILRAHRHSAPLLLEGTARWLSSDSSLDRPATIAEQVDGQQIAPYLALLPLGILGQALRVEAGRGEPVSALLEQVVGDLERGLGGVLASLDARPVSPDQLAEIVVDVMGWLFEGWAGPI